MSWTTVEIKRVGPSSDARFAQTQRGVFNLDSVLDYLSQPVGTDVDEIIVDLTRVGWVSLFDWWCFTALLHGKLEANPNQKISLDFIGDRLSGLIPYPQCADFIKGQLRDLKYSQDDYVDSYVVHRVLNFIMAVESIEGFSNIAGGRLVLRHVSGEYAARKVWYLTN